MFYCSPCGLCVIPSLPSSMTHVMITLNTVHCPSHLPPTTSNITRCVPMETGYTEISQFYLVTTNWFELCSSSFFPICKKGWKPNRGFPVGVCTFSCVCMGLVQVLLYSPTSQRRAHYADSKLKTICNLTSKL